MTNVRIKKFYINCLLIGLFILLFGNETFAQSVLPSTFHNTRKNEIIGDSSLTVIFQKLSRNQSVKVMQIGDSHVKKTEFPRAIERTLRKYFPQIEFVDYGIYGARAQRFCEDDMIQHIAVQHPDLVIISFGTNEAHGNKLDERGKSAHEKTMNLLTKRIQECCPGVCLIFTTPPGSYISQRTSRYTTGQGKYRQTRYSTTKIVNTNTENIVRSIVEYCKKNHYAVWDLYTIAGGVKSASQNWRRSGLMNKDCIHFLPDGYTLHGNLLGEAIYEAYKKYSK